MNKVVYGKKVLYLIELYPFNLYHVSDYPSTNGIVKRSLENAKVFVNKTTLKRTFLISKWINSGKIFLKLKATHVFHALCPCCWRAQITLLLLKKRNEKHMTYEAISRRSLIKTLKTNILEQKSGRSSQKKTFNSISETVKKK